MTYTGTMMKDLLAITDNAVELSRRARGETWHERFFRGDSKPDPIEIYLHAREHLANHHEMTKGDIAAWWDLGWLQERVMCETGRCSALLMVHFGETFQCQGKALTFCGACGTELCLEHTTKCCWESFCDFCLHQHAKGHPRQ